jgi:hypothetical protein
VEKTKACAPRLTYPAGAVPPLIDPRCTEGGDRMKLKTNLKAGLKAERVETQLPGSN